MSSIRHSAFGIRHFLFLMLALPIVPAALAQAAEAVAPDLRLEYALRAWTGARALGRTVGSVTMEFSNEKLDGQPTRVLRVRIQASFLTIRINALSESFMTPDLNRELLFHYIRTGGEQTESKLVFGPTEVDYHKLVHCDAGEACKNPDHQVASPLHFLNGRTCHCSGCNRAEHCEWRVLCHHPSNPPVCDMFAAVYLARAEGMTVGGPARTTRCAADLKLWDVAFRPVERETVTVPAGTFDTVRVELSPTPANAHAAAEEFRGPFGMGPDTKMWIEPDQRLLVKLTGTAHMGIAPQTEMNLVRVTKAP